MELKKYSESVIDINGKDTGTQTFLALEYGGAHIRFEDFVYVMVCYFMSCLNKRPRSEAMQQDSRLFESLHYYLNNVIFRMDAMAEKGNDDIIYANISILLKEFITKKLKCQDKNLRNEFNTFAKRTLIFGQFVKKVLTKDSVKNAKLDLEGKNKWNAIVSEAHKILKNAKPEDFAFKEDDFKKYSPKDDDSGQVKEEKQATLKVLESATEGLKFDKNDLNWLKELFAKDICVKNDINGIRDLEGNNIDLWRSYGQELLHLCMKN